MKLKNMMLFGLLLAATAGFAYADDAADCSAGMGTLVTGQVVTGPSFKSGAPLHGVKLTHTHVSLKVDGSDTPYDVAIDNVFAADFVKNSSTSPASLMAINVGDHLELCGKLYTTGGPGIDWVHTNCGDAPTSSKPNGWIKVVAGDGSLGANLDATQTYCTLWQKGSSKHHN